MKKLLRPLYLVPLAPEYTSVRDWPVESGDPITETDVRSATRVALIGATVAEKLFLDADPVGFTMRIRNQPFQVIGVLKKKGQSLDGRDQDDSILVPITTAQSKLFGNRLLGAIGSISLIVGGIGIMNIMLVSVTERTREIGIRMAIGARRRDVLIQFLLEALMICIVGGLVGILIGVGGAVAVSKAMALEIELSGTVALVAFAVSAATGIFFGFWPARRAAGLRPVEALRYE